MTRRALFACLPLGLALSACQHAATPAASDATTTPRVLLLGEVHDSAVGPGPRAGATTKVTLQRTHTFRVQALESGPSP